MVPSYAGSIAFSHPDCFTPNRRSNGGGPIPSNAVSNGRPCRQTVRAANHPMGGALDPSIFPMRAPMRTSSSPTGAALGALHDSIAAVVGPLCVPPESCGFAQRVHKSLHGYIQYMRVCAYGLGTQGSVGESSCTSTQVGVGLKLPVLRTTQQQARRPSDRGDNRYR